MLVPKFLTEWQYMCFKSLDLKKMLYVRHLSFVFVREKILRFTILTPLLSGKSKDYRKSYKINHGYDRLKKN